MTLPRAARRVAIALVAAGVCDAETIDIVVREGFGARTAVLGPMEQSDLVGLDLALDIAEVLYQHLDRTAGPHAFLRDKVKAGKLGMKTGEGLRKWTAQEADAVPIDGGPTQRSFTATVSRHGNPLAALLVNRPRELPTIRTLIQKGNS